jgi:WD40-like Beta Propeller Repeat
MNDRQWRDLLREAEVPGERDAGQRAWAVAERAYAERREAPRHSRGPRLLLAVAGAIVLALAVLSPAGAAIRDWVSDVVGPGNEHARPALSSLPAPGELLVNSQRGPWVVQADGTQRLLGAYTEAAWSPHGVYVVAARGPRLVTLEADGDPRWALTAPGPVTMPTWQAPDGFRIAYLSGDSLRVVAGDGTRDRQVAARVAPVSPAWRPGARHVLAFVDAGGEVALEDTDSGRRLLSLGFPLPRGLAWSTDGDELAVATGSGVAVIRPFAREGESFAQGRPNATVGQVAFSPSGSRIAFIRSSQAGSDLVLGRSAAKEIPQHTLFSIPGHLVDPTWSPDGRWLLVGWREADQWLFIDTDNPSKVIAINNIDRQFDPGASATGEFPRISGWCCAP